MDEELRELILKWIQKAENDLKTAQQSLQADDVVTDTICFHCQQSVEKYLKAYLVSRNVIPDKTHKIENLLEKCKIIDESFTELEDTKILTEYAVELRYPDDFYIPDLDEAKAAYELAEKTKVFIMNILNI